MRLLDDDEAALREMGRPYRTFPVLFLTLLAILLTGCVGLAALGG